MLNCSVEVLVVGPNPDKDRIVVHLVDGAAEMHLSQKNSKAKLVTEWIEHLSKIVSQQKGELPPNGISSDSAIRRGSVTGSSAPKLGGPGDRMSLVLGGIVGSPGFASGRRASPSVSVCGVSHIFFFIYKRPHLF